MPSRERYGVPREEVWVLECGIEYLEVTQRIAEPPSWTRMSFVPDRRVAPGIGLQQAARPLWVARRFPSWCVLGK